MSRLVFLHFPPFVITINTTQHHPSPFYFIVYLYFALYPLLSYSASFLVNCRLLLLPWYWVVADLLATPLFVSRCRFCLTILIHNNTQLFPFLPTPMSAQSKSSPSRFAEKMAKLKIPGLRRSRTSMISDDNSDESSSLKTSSSSSVPEENSVGYPSTKSSSSLNTPGRSSPDRPRIQRPNSELISPSHLANLVTPPNIN